MLWRITEALGRFRRVPAVLWVITAFPLVWEIVVGLRLFSESFIDFTNSPQSREQFYGQKVLGEQVSGEQVSVEQVSVEQVSW